MSEMEEMDQPAIVPASLAAPRVEATQSKVERDMKAFEDLFVDTAPLGPSRPRFAELSEEPPFKPLPRDFAGDLGNGVRPPAPAEQPVAALFAEKRDDLERDLDVPAFMRRMQF
jgi:cell division protein FtsZ